MKAIKRLRFHFKYMFISILLLLFYSSSNSKRINIYNSARNVKTTSTELSGIQAINDENVQKMEFPDKNISSSTTKDAIQDPENEESELIKDKIFWSDHFESFVPKGVTFKETKELVKSIRRHVAKTFRKGSSEMCGDSENAIVGFDNGKVVCARYKRDPLKAYAEVLAFYLSRMLQMDNVPETVLEKINTTAARWKKVNTGMLSWKDNQIVAITRQIPRVCHCTFMPQMIKEAYLKGETVTRSMFLSDKIFNQTDIADIIQWGTLIIFDNLIANFDRLDYWKRHGFTDHLHNGLKSPEGKIWLIDHELSIFHPFDFYKMPKYNYNRLLEVHEKMLKTMCVFQSSVVSGLQELSTHRSPFTTLWRFSRSREPLLDTVLNDYSFAVVADLFRKRLTQILQWIEHCKEVHT